MQAQPMLLHDTSSNQLVETAILSTDPSQSAVLQGVLHQHQQPARRSNRSPVRERTRSPLCSRDHSQDHRQQYRRRSPSPEYRQHSPPADLAPHRKAIATCLLPMSRTKAHVATCHLKPAIQHHDPADHRISTNVREANIGNRITRLPLLLSPLKTTLVTDGEQCLLFILGPATTTSALLIPRCHEETPHDSTCQWLANSRRTSRALPVASFI